MNTDIALIDAQTAYDLLAAAVTERGADYVDPNAVECLGCRYIENGAPSCGVGLALSLHDVPLETLQVWETQYGESIEAIYSNHNSDIDWLDDAAVDVLQTFQTHQDDGDTWGVALHAARDALEALTA